MKRVRLIAWDADDAKRRAAELEREGIYVDSSPLHPSGLISQFKDVMVVCIDLDRLPSHGREIAVALRQTKATKYLPIVFAGGPKDKVLRIKKELPDAVYVEWPAAPFTLRKLSKKPPAPAPAAAVPGVEPVKPPSHMERYAGSTLEKKLGIAADMKVALIGAPEGFVESLKGLPDGVQWMPRMNAETKLTMWFARTRADVEREVEFFASRLKSGTAIWIFYPKKSGRHKTDLTQTDLRAIGLKAGLVDYKICAVDDDWSGMKFTRKK